MHESIALTARCIATYSDGRLGPITATERTTSTETETGRIWIKVRRRIGQLIVQELVNGATVSDYAESRSPSLG